MGCANSKPKGCDYCHCKGPYSSVPRSYSVHVHHPPQSKGDSYHVVALTSTTLGSLDQVSHNHGNGLRFPNGKVIDNDSFKIKKKHEEVVLEEAKTWSEMIEQKLPKAIIPRTPTTTPPCEPETINTWELMEGLEDISPFRSPKHFKSFSFGVSVNGHVDQTMPSGVMETGTDCSHKPIWPCKEGSNDSSPYKAAARVPDFGKNHVVVSSLFEKQESKNNKGFSLEEEKKISDDDDVVMDLKCGKDNKVVFYFTSLRGVRKTFEDCCRVRLILKGLGVKVDERDVSMHSGFKEELRELLGQGYGKGGLPRVFVGRNYIGGAEEIQQLHEGGKLEKLLGCCEKVDKCNGGDGGEICEVCGDIRFVPCETCYGSCKIYYEGDDGDDEGEEDGEIGEYGFQRCPDCNENGLIRCPMCCCY